MTEGNYIRMYTCTYISPYYMARDFSWQIFLSFELKYTHMLSANGIYILQALMIIL